MDDASSVVARNARSRERLRATLSRLTEADFARPIGHGWTVGACLAHLAYWDRQNRVRLLRWEELGPAGIRVPQTAADSINDILLPEWLGATPKAVTAEVIEAAESLDEVIAALSPEVARAAFAVRPRSVDRSLHRGEHLDEVERALSEVSNG
jgi:hypothetical protein